MSAEKLTRRQFAARAVILSAVAGFTFDTAFKGLHISERGLGMIPDYFRSKNTDIYPNLEFNSLNRFTNELTLAVEPTEFIRINQSNFRQTIEPVIDELSPLFVGDFTQTEKRFGTIEMVPLESQTFFETKTSNQSGSLVLNSYFENKPISRSIFISNTAHELVHLFSFAEFIKSQTNPETSAQVMSALILAKAAQTNPEYKRHFLAYILDLSQAYVIGLGTNNMRYREELIKNIPNLKKYYSMYDQYSLQKRTAAQADLHSYVYPPLDIIFKHLDGSPITIEEVFIPSAKDLDPEPMNKILRETGITLPTFAPRAERQSNMSAQKGFWARRLANSSYLRG